MSLKLLNEGGNAVPGVSRINQENVSETMNDIYKKLLPVLNVSKEDTALLGSTGKKLPGGSSGDVDLAISKEALCKNNDIKPENVLSFIESKVKKFGIAYNVLKGLGIVSVGWPIANVDGKQEGATVQLDLMLSDNVNMTSWGMYSPYESQQPWKGAVRNTIMYWIATLVDYKVLRKEINELGEEYDTEFERHVFDPQRGLARLKQSFYSIKTGKLGKNKKTVFREIVNDNPDLIVKILFGDKYAAKDILTVDDCWKAMMSPDFPYKDYRLAIIKHVIDDCEAHGFSYPEYFNKYVESNGQSVVTESMEVLMLEASKTEYDSPREGMIKIHQMKPAQFVDFIKQLKSVSKKGVLDLSQLNASEKVDGSGLRIIVNNGAIGLESSYSGVVFNADEFSLEPFRNTLQYLQDNLSNELTSICETLKQEGCSGMKLTGELFYINDLTAVDKDNSVTFVGTKYDYNKLGSFASVVLFDVQGIRDNKLVSIDESLKDKIMDEMRDLSTSEFKFFNGKDIKWSGEFKIRVNYDTKEANAIMRNPDMLLDKVNKETFEAFRDAMAHAFSNQIAERGSVFGVPGSEVEGIVFEINGKKFGATNFGWKDTKASYYNAQTEFQNTIDNFLKTVFGFIKPKKILQLLSEPDAKQKFGVPFKKEVGPFKEKLKVAKDKFDNDKNIPASVRKMATFFVNSNFNKMMNLTDDVYSLKQALTR